MLAEHPVITCILVALLVLIVLCIASALIGIVLIKPPRGSDAMEGILDDLPPAHVRRRGSDPSGAVVAALILALVVAGVMTVRGYAGEAKAAIASARLVEAQR